LQEKPSARPLISVRAASSMTSTLSKQAREQVARALSPNRHCPRCTGAIFRVRRRAIDRVIGLIFPRHRYRCKSSQCAWEGTLPFTKR